MSGQVQKGGSTTTGKRAVLSVRKERSDQRRELDKNAIFH